MLKAGGKEFSFADRNRRPPKDPINTVLSYLYCILVKDLFVTHDVDRIMIVDLGPLGGRVEERIEFLGVHPTQAESKAIVV